MSTVVDRMDAGLGKFVARIVGEYPVRLAFFASLLLSVIAVFGSPTLGRDAAFYLSIAERVSLEGPQVAWQFFNWPWFTYLLAATHVVTRLPLEWCAHLWCGLFMAGTCALLVDVVRQRAPAAAGWACLVVLAMPAVNQFRNDIIREYGFWFFCVLALWLVMRWQARGGWLRASAIHLAIGSAMLFRLEALVLEVALLLWLLVGVREEHGVKRLVQFLVLPLLGGVVGLLALLAKGGATSGRVQVYLEMLDPRGVYAAFRQVADQFGDSMTYKYSRDETGRIVFFGMLAALLIKFVSLSGPFSLPFLRHESWRALRTYLRDYQVFAWAALMYLAVLMLFFINMQFMNGRYLSFLNLLTVPLLAVGIWHFASRFPRMSKVLLVVGLLMMLSNVISTGARKTHLIEAGEWVSANLDPQAKVYYDDGRVSYYAGRGYVVSPPQNDVIHGKAVQQYSYFVLEGRPGEPWLTTWLEQHQMRVLASFANRKNATVVVIGR
ncbi:hypothetical protein ACQKPE_05190 [Pseudomonas sp. NPDC089554]|uniref:hypothetical protein n=1 Tax=Pseudomonas sp. NPDC089554 TaxID=3390653 RepID=UPI003CFE3D91